MNEHEQKKHTEITRSENLWEIVSATAKVAERR